MKYTYHKAHKYTTLDNDEVRFISQLYQLGIYAIINDDSSLQFNLGIKDVVRMEKKLNKSFKEGKIKDLEFYSPITVTDEGGLLKEIDE